jgi:hypothetical protein
VKTEKQLLCSLSSLWNDNANIKQEIIEEEEPEREEVTEQLQLRTAPQELYVTRSGRISRPPARLIETAYATIRETYLDNFCHIENDTKELVECTYAVKALLFQKAMQQKPVEAMRALREEVIKAMKIDIWDPVHPKDMSAEERKLIIPQMMNYLEKYRPDLSFEKFKVRVLTRGDKQVYTGETEGPVARVESLMMLLAIAIHQDLEVFKVDVGSAFMRTPMADDVKHKWVKLDPRVVQILNNLQPDKYKDYILPDGTVIVKMKKLSYGYVEAAHYWWKDLSSTFTENGYTVCHKDKCVFVKRDHEGRIAICGTTVDDYLFVCTRDSMWIQQQIQMLQQKYEEVTTEEGDQLGIIGMQVCMDRRLKQVTITQPKQVARVIETFQVTKGAPNPALVKLMGDDEESPMLKNQSDYMSKCATC